MSGCLISNPPQAAELGSFAISLRCGAGSKLRYVSNFECSKARLIVEGYWRNENFGHQVPQLNSCRVTTKQRATSFLHSSSKRISKLLSSPQAIRRASFKLPLPHISAYGACYHRELSITQIRTTTPIFRISSLPSLQDPLSPIKEDRNGPE